jgi:hypothetical protein
MLFLGYEAVVGLLSWPKFGARGRGCEGEQKAASKEITYAKAALPRHASSSRGCS